MGEGVLKFVTCLQICFVFKYLLFNFAGEGFFLLVIFCGRHKCLIPKEFKITNNSVIRGSNFSFNIKPDTNFHSQHTTNNPQPVAPFLQSTDDQTKGTVTSSWDLIFHVKKTVA